MNNESNTPNEQPQQSPQAKLEYMEIMLTPQHTPGPWYVNTSTPTDNSEETALAVFPVTVAAGTVGSLICKISPLSSMDETDLYNASAIAATPQLLAASSSLLNALFAHADADLLDKLSGDIQAMQDVLTQALIGVEPIK